MSTPEADGTIRRWAPIFGTVNQDEDDAHVIECARSMMTKMEAHIRGNRQTCSNNLMSALRKFAEKIRTRHGDMDGASTFVKEICKVVKEEIDIDIQSLVVTKTRPNKRTREGDGKDRPPSQGPFQSGDLWAIRVHPAAAAQKWRAAMDGSLHLEIFTEMVPEATAVSIASAMGFQAKDLDSGPIKLMKKSVMLTTSKGTTTADWAPPDAGAGAKLFKDRVWGIMDDVWISKIDDVATAISGDPGFTVSTFGSTKWPYALQGVFTPMRRPVPLGQKDAPFVWPSDRQNFSAVGLTSDPTVWERIEAGFRGWKELARNTPMYPCSGEIHPLLGAPLDWITAVINSFVRGSTPEDRLKDRGYYICQSLPYWSERRTLTAALTVVFEEKVRRAMLEKETSYIEQESTMIQLSELISRLGTITDGQRAKVDKVGQEVYNYYRVEWTGVEDMASTIETAFHNTDLRGHIRRHLHAEGDLPFPERRDIKHDASIIMVNKRQCPHTEGGHRPSNKPADTRFHVFQAVVIEAATDRTKDRRFPLGYTRPTIIRHTGGPASYWKRGVFSTQSVDKMSQHNPWELFPSWTPTSSPIGTLAVTTSNHIHGGDDPYNVGTVRFVLQVSDEPEATQVRAWNFAHWSDAPLRTVASLMVSDSRAIDRAEGMFDQADSKKINTFIRMSRKVPMYDRVVRAKIIGHRNVSIGLHHFRSSDAVLRAVREHVELFPPKAKKEDVKLGAGPRFSSDIAELATKAHTGGLKSPEYGLTPSHEPLPMSSVIDSLQLAFIQANWNSLAMTFDTEVEPYATIWKEKRIFGHASVVRRRESISESQSFHYDGPESFIAMTYTLGDQDRSTLWQDQPSDREKDWRYLECRQGEGSMFVSSPALVNHAYVVDAPASPDSTSWRGSSMFIIFRPITTEAERKTITSHQTTRSMKCNKAVRNLYENIATLIEKGLQAPSLRLVEHFSVNPQTIGK